MGWCVCLLTCEVDLQNTCGGGELLQSGLVSGTLDSRECTYIALGVSVLGSWAAYRGAQCTGDRDEFPLDTLGR